MSSSSVVLDATGRLSPAAMPGHNAGRPPRNKGVRYPADPPTVEEIGPREKPATAGQCFPVEAGAGSWASKRLEGGWRARCAFRVRATRSRTTVLMLANLAHAGSRGRRSTRHQERRVAPTGSRSTGGHPL
jgi:hypothetical protein